MEKHFSKFSDIHSMLDSVGHLGNYRIQSYPKV